MPNEILCPNECEGFVRAVNAGLDVSAWAVCPECGTALITDPRIEAARDLGILPPSAEGAELLADDLGLELPDRIGEVIGWRAWRVVTLGSLVRLRSAVHSAHWPATDWTYAECGNYGIQRGADVTARRCENSDDHRIPGDHCSCGMYAALDPDHLQEIGYNSRYSGADGTTVVGQVAMAGKIIRGDLGWRGEKARIYKLFVPWDRELAQALANQYRVPVEMRNVYEMDSDTFRGI